MNNRRINAVMLVAMLLGMASTSPAIGGVWTRKAACCAVSGKICVVRGTRIWYPGQGISTLEEYDTGLENPSPDFTGDEVIDINDLEMLMERWGTDGPLCDIAPPPDGDGVVDMKDLEVFMSYWEPESSTEILDVKEWTIYNTANSGLPYNGVVAIAFDQQGTTWIGTGRWWAHEGGGLAKFDGTNWAVYNTANSSLPDNDHTGLLIDASGNVWSGTEDGLSKCDGVNWTVYKTDNSGMMSNQSGAPVFDADGNAWIACGCLAKFDGDNWTTYHTGNSGLPNNFVTGVAIDTYGNIWAGTFGNGVARFDGQNWTVYSTVNSALPHNDVSFLAADGVGNVWAGTYGGGLAKFNGTAWTAYTMANSGLPDDWIWNLSVDAQDTVWVGTRAGLARFDGADWTVYDTGNSGLPDNNVYCAAFDAEGRIWVGTQDGGLAVLRPQPTVDFNGDGIVDIEDLVILFEHQGTNDTLCDIGPTPWGDGVVDRADLEVLMSYYGQEVTDLTLVAHWRLDETEGTVAFDSAAGHHDGTVLGDPLWHPDGGQVGGALELSGLTNLVTTPFVRDPSEGPLSVLVWVKGGAPGQGIVSQAGGANWLMAGPVSGVLMTDLKDAGRWSESLLSQTVITDGNWHRVGLVCDGSSRALYVDHVVAAEDPEGLLVGSLAGLYLGATGKPTVGSFWAGLIDDVRIYDRVVRP